PQQWAGPDRLALLLREGDGGDLGAAEHAAEHRRAADEHCEERPRHGCPRLAAAVGRSGGRLGPALCREGQAAEQTAGGRGHETRGGVDAGREDGDDDRTGDEDHLVHHRLVGEGRVQLRVRAQQVHPAGAHARADLGHRRPGQDGQQVGHGCTEPLLHGPDGAAEARGGDGDHHRQHPALAEAVDEPTAEDRQRRVAQDVRRGHDPRRAVRPGRVLHQEHQAEADHRDRESSDQAGQGERECAGATQHGAVGGEHRRTSYGAAGAPSAVRTLVRPPYDGGMTATPWAPYDALLLVSFGGPEKPEDVVPFLQNVTAGKNIPVERLEEVGEHYYGFGGRSPINDQNRALIAAVEQDFAAHGIDLPVYWGNRNWDPYLTDTLRRMAHDGVRRVACWVTSAYSSYSGCRQYRENFADSVAALAAEGVEAPHLDRLRHYFNHPGFVEANLDATADALRTLEERTGADAAAAARLVFVTHSIPDAMEDASGASPAEGLPGGAYTRQHRDLAAIIVAGIAERTGRTHDHDLVFCSRSGPPQVPWLEPDVNDHLAALAGDGVPAVVLIPI